MSTPNPRPPGPMERWLQRRAASLSFWFGIVFFIAFLGVLRQLTLDTHDPPPILETIRSFTLKNQREEPFGTAELEGRVWIGSVICTECAAVNPTILERLAEVQHRARGLGTSFQLVSLSVDPVVDTPEALQRLGRTLGASLRAWVFLRGDEAVLSAVISDLYGSSSGSVKDGDLQGSLAPDQPHVAVLVDLAGRVRGRYDLRDDDALTLMMTHAGIVVNQPAVVLPKSQ